MTRLQALRRQHDLSPCQVADIVGTTPEMLLRIERGEVEPPWSLGHRLAVAWGTLDVDLFDRDTGLALPDRGNLV